MYCKPPIVVQLGCRWLPVCVVLPGCNTVVGHGIKDTWIWNKKKICKSLCRPHRCQGSAPQTVLMSDVSLKSQVVTCTSHWQAILWDFQRTQENTYYDWFMVKGATQERSCGHRGKVCRRGAEFPTSLWACHSLNILVFSPVWKLPEPWHLGFYGASIT